MAVKSVSAREGVYENVCEGVCEIVCESVCESVRVCKGVCEGVCESVAFSPHTCGDTDTPSHTSTRTKVACLALEPTEEFEEKKGEKKKDEETKSLLPSPVAVPVVPLVALFS